MALELKDGKFFRDGVQEPLKFGDKDQITLMNRAIEYAKDMQGDGLVLEPDYTIEATVTFKCLCGTRLSIQEYPDSEDDISCFVGSTERCHKCGKEYELSENDDGDLVVKLEKKD